MCATLTCGTLLAPIPSRGETSRIGPGLFVSGIPRDQLEYFAAPQVQGRQRQSNWCWAAAVQMVLNYHGLYVTQEQVVAKIFGELINKPGAPENILGALSGWAPDTRGRFSNIYASALPLRGSDLVHDLNRRWPLIVGLKQPGNVGHAYVLTGVTYKVGRNGQLIFRSVILRDPWPRSQSRIEMGWADFESRLTFAARVRVDRL
ncbi:MAG: papain-like cysteine protease family protein [Scytonema sp. PMC 1069.18]|nr:papain-like cysteine protease family protein [Scytonema sp. PMC 1069.18]